MNQNKLATDREEDVDDTLLEFDDVTEDALNDHLMVRLPMAFKEVSNENRNAADDEQRGKKRKTPTEDADPNKVLNKNPVSEFIATDEEKRKFSKLFGGNNVCHRVDWNGRCKMCPRWHSKEYCFKDCKNRDSHVAADEIPADKKKKYGEYLNKKIRKN